MNPKSMTHPLLTVSEAQAVPLIIAVVRQLKPYLVSADPSIVLEALARPLPSGPFSTEMQALLAAVQNEAQVTPTNDTLVRAAVLVHSYQILDQALAKGIFDPRVDARSAVISSDLHLHQDAVWQLAKALVPYLCFEPTATLLRKSLDGLHEKLYPTPLTA